MSVEPRELTSETWTRWQGHAINGVFPLGRYLGGSDHSGVFLTQSAARACVVAIKLVPTNRALAETLLRRWKRAGALTHPHLLRLLEWGGCQLDGLPYLYAVMEYADQTLAQLLQHRALTGEEAQEMLWPTLQALSFLHGQNLLQGQLKPANILVVGEQLKLASDTIRRVTDGAAGTAVPAVSDPLETQDGSSSAAGDIWALGVSLFEALTRLPLSGLSGSRAAAALPADVSPALRDVIARCLSPDSQDRPDVNELIAMIRKGSSGAAPAAGAQAAALAPGPVAAEQVPPPPLLLASANTARPASAAAAQPMPRGLLTGGLGALLLLALVLGGVRLFRFAHTSPSPPSPVHASAPAPRTGARLRAQRPGVTRPAPARLPEPVPAESAAAVHPSEVVRSPSAPRQVIPEVPQSALRTIRGHIKVWVRVSVEQDGAVSGAVMDRTGPSRYFQRMAMQAARQWTFPAVQAASRRAMQVRFDFSRDGTMAHAVAVQ
jgi:outer membrane biosynthesis protein TonB